VTRSLDRFFFSPEPDGWLSVLRIGLGLQVLLYCWSLRKDWDGLLSAGGGPGLIGRDAAEVLLGSGTDWVPRVSWCLKLTAAAGLNEHATLAAIWGLLFAAGIFLVVGLYARPAAITGWLLHLCVAKSANLFAYGMDNFTTIGLFYLMLSPLPDSYALDFHWRAKVCRWSSFGRFFHCVLRLHLCIAYFFGGITKIAGLGWWNGLSIWRALTSPPFDLIAPETLISLRAIFPVLAVSVCLLEIGYPILIWPRWTRNLWLAAILAMHVSIGLSMGLYLFSFVMIVLNLAAFGPTLPAIRRSASTSADTGRIIIPAQGAPDA
jgi:uncharacterized membrane protein YphA (DoxX/SURF4 family)